MSGRPLQPDRKKPRIVIVWDDSVPPERRAEYGESIRQSIRATARPDGQQVLRARVSARGSDLHVELEPSATS